MAKILIVYYSRSGTTKKVAQRLAKASDADLLPIQDTATRSGALGYLRCALEAAFHTKAAIKDGILPQDYDVIVLGTPIWFWNMSSPVRAFITQNKHGFKRLALFCTYGGGGAEKVLREMETLSGTKALATLALRDQELLGDANSEKLSEFALGLNKLADPRTMSVTGKPVAQGTLAST